MRSEIRNPQSDIRNLPARDHAVFWHPCSQMKDYEAFPPLEVVAAQGCRIQLADGRWLYDAISSWWCKSLGHGHPRLRAALTEQAQRFEHVITANTTSEALVSLCERLLAMADGGWRMADGRTRNAEPKTSPLPAPFSAATCRVPPSIRHPPSAIPHFQKVFFADNGSTAVEVALKMALQAQLQRGQPQRTTFASFRGGYHGETAATMSISDLDLYSSPFAPLMFPVTKLGPLPYRTGPDDPRWHDCSDEWPTIEAQLDAVKDQLAAIVYEPVLQAAGGMKLYSPDLLVRLRKWADTHGVYLIADEIAAGLYRCGTALASHWAGRGRGAEGPRGQVKGADNPAALSLHSTPRPLGLSAPRPPLPDFAILSKGLTAGFLPMAVVLTTQPVYALFYDDYATGKAFLHSNTYAGNALGVAVAHAALDTYRDENIPAHVATMGPLLRDAFADLMLKRPYLKNLRQLGMVVALDLRHPDGSPLPPPPEVEARTGYRVYQETVRRGALFRSLGDTMYLFPPLNTTPPEVDAMVSILADALDAVLG